MTDLNRTATLSGYPAYKLTYQYLVPYNHPITAVEIFTIRDHTAYTVSVKSPTTMSFQYMPRADKIIDSFTIIK